MARNTANRYSQLIEHIFHSHYNEGDVEVAFKREELISTAQELGIRLPLNLGDVIYSFRYRAALPDSIKQKATKGNGWIVRPIGRGLYKFVMVREWDIRANEMMSEIKIPDATPGIVAKYLFDDEQALLAKLRYNRMIDIFTGLTCYSLQNHLRTTVPNMGQVETDEIYVGIDHSGSHFILPIQAKGGNDRHNVVQIEQDIALCATKFPNLICRAIGAQFMEDDLIALFEFETGEQGVTLRNEKHFLLVPPEDISKEDLLQYRQNYSLPCSNNTDDITGG